MQIAVIFLAVAGFFYILYTYPRLRLAGGLVMASAIAGLTFYLVVTDPEPQVELGRITTDEIILSDLILDLGVRTSSLTGRVVNGSAEYVLSGVSLDVRVYDCPADDTPLDQCFTIGEDDGYARVTVPPGQLRDFSAVFLFNNLPEITGVLRWDHTITALRAIEDTQN